MNRVVSSRILDVIYAARGSLKLLTCMYGDPVSPAVMGQLLLGTVAELREAAEIVEHRMNTNERQQIKQIIDSAQDVINNTFYSGNKHVTAEDAAYSGHALRVFEDMCTSLEEIVSSE